MEYLWLRVFHITAVTVWVAGMLIVAVTLRTRLSSSKHRGTTSLAAIRRWDQRVTTPAMLAVWTLGLTLGITGDWFSSRWLMLKLILVFVLSGIHGAMSGNLRRLVADPDRDVPAYLRYAAPVIIATVFLVVTLVGLKPF